MHDDAGLEMLEAASAAGKKEATFVLGMLMLAEGKARKPVALQLLNTTYPSPRSATEVKATAQKVEFMLRRDGRRDIAFHGCQLTCKRHTCSRDYGLVMGSPWLVGCDVCLWEACFMRFARVFGMPYGDCFWF